MTICTVQSPIPVQGAAQFGSGVCAIGEQVAQPREAVTDGFEQLRRAVPILDLGAVHQQSDEQAESIGHDMALAPVDLLAGVIAPDTAAFRGFRALAVDHAGARAGLAPLKLPRRHKPDDD